MAAEGGDFIIRRYIYRGVEGEVIPRHVTHVIVDELTTVVLAQAFWEHPNIIEIICHDKVERIEEDAFYSCTSLRRVIMPGVKIIEANACSECATLTDVECGKLEIIKDCAFQCCDSLRRINLPSARIAEGHAFYGCKALTEVKFGSKIERIEEVVFGNCKSLERITISLKEDIIDQDDIFQGCNNLKHVDLIERVVLDETVAALLLEEWRNNMYEEIDSINEILLNAPSGFWRTREDGEKARAIRRWIRSVLGKIVQYKAEHQRILDEAATTLQQSLPRDIVMNSVLPFLDLPLHTFE